MRLCNIQLQVPEFLWYQDSFLSPQSVCSGISGEQEGLCLGRTVLLRWWWLMVMTVHLGVMCAGVVRWLRHRCYRGKSGSLGG